MIRRRLYVEVRVSKLATWSRWIAIFSLPVVAIAILLHRLGMVEYSVAYATLVAGFAVALLGLIVAVAAFIVIWNEGLRGLGRAITATAIGLVLVGWPAVELTRGTTLPAIVDITTDFSDPPRFVAVASARPHGANPIAYPDGEVARLQRAAYPGVKPFEIEANPDEVFNMLMSIVERRGWRVLDNVSPRGGERDGRIEAVARTLVMGFREDISIRVRTVDKGVRIDMRSASRYGQHDFGSNARRIEGFMAEFADTRRKAMR
ncbi:MAG TPA: DUF1499 domain-containing protein [Xanthobacteraceae bacterium]|nr:DUF1499 domain-containing protein [Xanthobacteraceae bacterium]